MKRVAVRARHVVYGRGGAYASTAACVPHPDHLQLFHDDEEGRPAAASHALTAAAYVRIPRISTSEVLPGGWRVTQTTVTMERMPQRSRWPFFPACAEKSCAPLLRSGQGTATTVRGERMPQLHSHTSDSAA